MKIMVSACLLGENCKYNGGSNRSEALLRKPGRYWSWHSGNSRTC